MSFGVELLEETEERALAFECPSASGRLMTVYIGHGGVIEANGERKWLMASEEAWHGRMFCHTLATAWSKAALVELAMCWGMLPREEA